MARKEEIIYAALELAAQNGLGSVTLSQIADKLGIKKPSLYNHFRSKDEMIGAMYVFLRQQAQKTVLTPPESIYELPLEQILTSSLRGYLRFLSDKNIMMFFKVLYSERSIAPAAARIVLHETEHMIKANKALFYALVVHGKMTNRDVDTAAYTYTMAIHSMIDNRMDMVTAGDAQLSDITALTPEITSFIKWFCERIGTDEK